MQAIFKGQQVAMRGAWKKNEIMQIDGKRPASHACRFEVTAGYNRVQTASR
jgi:hypothetical protein